MIQRNTILDRWMRIAKIPEGVSVRVWEEVYEGRVLPGNTSVIEVISERGGAYSCVSQEVKDDVTEDLGKFTATVRLLIQRLLA